MPLFRRDVFSIRIFFTLNIVVCRLGEFQVRLPAFGKRKAVLSGFGSLRLDELFALGSGDAFAVPADDAVNALAIYHDVDGVPDVTIFESFCCDSVFCYFLAAVQAANSVTG